MSERFYTKQCRDCGKVVQLRNIRGRSVMVEDKPERFWPSKPGKQRAVNEFGDMIEGEFLTPTDPIKGDVMAHRLHSCRIHS